MQNRTIITMKGPPSGGLIGLLILAWAVDVAYNGCPIADAECVQALTLELGDLARATDRKRKVFRASEHW